MTRRIPVQTPLFDNLRNTGFFSLHCFAILLPVFSPLSTPEGFFSAENPNRFLESRTFIEAMSMPAATDVFNRRLCFRSGENAAGSLQPVHVEQGRTMYTIATLLLDIVCDSAGWNLAKTTWKMIESPTKDVTDFGGTKAMSKDFCTSSLSWPPQSHRTGVSHAYHHRGFTMVELRWSNFPLSLDSTALPPPRRGEFTVSRA